MVALFRLVELASGRILIDGQDISQLGLDKLRRNMAIIPQDPILFSGTVRTNLDPFGEYTDDAIWAVLKKAHLYEHIFKLEGGLQGVVAENGDNFSVRTRMCEQSAGVWKRRPLHLSVC
jgi:ATP-binding cassette subfamily C (CFTR/MRP) protein 1